MGNITWQSQSHRMVTSHIVTSHSHSMWQKSQLIDMRTVGNKMHSHGSNCIYSVANLTETLSSSLVNHWTKSSWLYSGLEFSFLILWYFEKFKTAVTNFIWSYLHQFFDDSHGLNGSQKPLKRPFDRYQSRLEAINDGWDIRQINR